MFETGIVGKGRADVLAFDSSGTFLIADQQVFQSGKKDPKPLGVRPHKIVASARKGTIAACNSVGVHFMDLAHTDKATQYKVKNVGHACFDSTGSLFALSMEKSTKIHLLATDGTLVKTLAMPDFEQNTDAAVAFGDGKDTLLAISGYPDAKMVAISTKTGSSKIFDVTKTHVKNGRVLRCGPNQSIYYDSGNASVVTDEGAVLWSAKKNTLAVSPGVHIVPKKNVVVVPRIGSKCEIVYYRLTDGSEMHRTKLKTSTIRAFACSDDHIAWSGTDSTNIEPLPDL